MRTCHVMWVRGEHRAIRRRVSGQTPGPLDRRRRARRDDPAARTGRLRRPLPRGDRRRGGHLPARHLPAMARQGGARRRRHQPTGPGRPPGGDRRPVRIARDRARALPPLHHPRRVAPRCRAHAHRRRRGDHPRPLPRPDRRTPTAPGSGLACNGPSTSTPSMPTQTSSSRPRSSPDPGTRSPSSVPIHPTTGRAAPPPSSGGPAVALRRRPERREHPALPPRPEDQPVAVAGPEGQQSRAHRRPDEPGRGGQTRTLYARRLRSIQAVFSWTWRRWVSRSAVTSSWARSASGNTERAVRATVS